eukprot:TRINITY_DN6652_c0_g1_i2.p1 TRINITY_DN6652_c0_g1~~TRINITY_DN6652_c0_g1_i2.p1  ORF type:complete len:541 (+),score=109.52 TRINITY_DN6652_c0_g1_i2:26-1624(+)
MSLYPKEAVKVAAEACGIANLNEDVSQTIAADLEYRLREIVQVQFIIVTVTVGILYSHWRKQEASKFTRHSRRRKMTTDDVNSALHARNLEPIYGYPAGKRAKSVESLFRRAGNTDVFYMPDSTVSLAAILKETLPKLPAPATYRAHWLAVDGVQPAIPQNPTMAVDSLNNKGGTQTKERQLQAPMVIKTKTAGAENDEPGEDDETEAVPTFLPVTEQQLNEDDKDDEDEMDEDDGRQVKGMTRHLLSREQQLLFKHVTQGIFGVDGLPAATSEDDRTQALLALEEDPGLHQLLPFFIEFVTDKVAANLKNLGTLRNVIDMVSRLVSNRHVFLEPYLHKLMPPLMTCIVGKHLCQDVTREDHWTLRKQAADLVVRLCTKFNDRYPDLQTRVIKTMITAFLNVKKPLSTQYGAVACLRAFGPRVAVTYLIDQLQFFIYKVLMVKEKDQLQAKSAAMIRELIKETCQGVAAEADIDLLQANQRVAILQVVDAELGATSLPLVHQRIAASNATNGVGSGDGDPAVSSSMDVKNDS